MKLSKNGLFVNIGFQTSDPFIDGRWDEIVKEVREKFPRIDLISFEMSGYIGLASISGSLDPVKLTITMHPNLVMGSNKKVNIMTQNQISELLDMISDLQI